MVLPDGEQVRIRLVVYVDDFVISCKNKETLDDEIRALLDADGGGF